VATLTVTGRADLSDAQWAVLGPLLPASKRGRPPKWTKRQLINGIRWRVRAGAPWRDVPAEYGPWPTVYGLFRHWQRDGTWAQVLAGLQARADAAGLITWDVSVDSTVARAHQHAAGARKKGICRPNPRAGPRTSRMITAWGAPAAGSPPRCTSLASRARNRSRSSLPRASVVTARSSRQCWNASGSPGQGRDGPGAGPGGYWLTRPTAPAATALTCGGAASGARSRRKLTSYATARTGAAPVAARPPSTQNATRTGTLRSHRPHRRDQRVAPTPLMKHALVTAWSEQALEPDAVTLLPGQGMTGEGYLAFGY